MLMQINKLIQGNIPLDKETKGIQRPFLNTTLPKSTLYSGPSILFKTWVEYFSNRRNMKVVAV